MRVVYLLRKPTTEPTVATNALRWGAGALNIDSGRIAAPLETIATHSRSLEASAKENRPVYGEYGPLTTHQTEGQRLGRWPANLILQHRPACVREGFRASYVGGPHNGQSHPGLTYADPDGTETVPAWRCAPECPVAALDVQSGVSISTGGKSSGFTAFGQGSGWNHHKNRPTEITRHQDTGGASRFFRQVHPGAP